MSLSVESVEEDTDYYTDAPLPSPMNTPYRTPQLSRKSSYQHDPSFPRAASPPSAGHPQHPRVGLMAHDPTMDETISLLDPRRFTPTLHANLVAEILSLRRELESKAQFIDSLEHDLSRARSEQETATTSIATAQREAREVKRKLAAAENDNAVEDVVKERDNAVETICELRRQVERLQKSRRIAEEDAQRTRKLAERDSERWEEVKRGLERRAHVAEGRLKMVLEELAAANAKSQEDPRPGTGTASETDTASIHMAGSDTASIRTISQAGYRPQSFMAGDDVAERFGVRFSQLGFGQSLADELNFPGEESEDIEEEDEGDEVEHDEEDEEEEEGEDDDEGMEEGEEDYLSELEEPEGMLTPIQLERLPVFTSEVSVQTEEEYPSAPQSPVTIVDPQQQLALAEKEVELALVLERIAELESKLNSKEKEVAEWERQDAERCSMLREKEEKLAHTQHILAGKEQKLEEQDMRLEELSLFVETTLKEVTKENHMVTTGMQTAEAEAEAKRKFMAPSPPPKAYKTGWSQTDPMPPPPPRKILTQWPPKPPPKPPMSIGTQTLPSLVPSSLSSPSKAVPAPVSAGTQTDPSPLKPEAPSSNTVSSATQTDLPPPPPPAVSAETQTDPPPPPAVDPPKIVPPPIAAGTQTDLPPSPPTTPKVATVSPVSAGTQTDQVTPAPALNRTVSPPPLLRAIPTIQVIPPPLTPPPVFPPRDSWCQTSPPAIRSTSIQTDEIQTDFKVTKFPPTLLPSALLSSTVPLPLPDTGPAPSLPRRSSKRVARRDAPTASFAQAPSFMEGALTEEPMEELDLAATPPPISKGKAKARDSFSILRPIRTSSLLPSSGLDMLGSSDEESLNLSDSEFKTILSAPKPRKRFSKGQGAPEKQGSRQSSIRRNALITSGSQAHASSSSGIGPLGPPFPVPTRFSSRKVTPTGSERTISPTPTGISRHTGRSRRNPSLRKSRSATALSTSTTNTARSPLPSTSSIAPESPYFPPPLPRDHVRSPAFPTRSYETKFQTRYDSKYDNKHDTKSDANKENRYGNKYESSIHQPHQSQASTNTHTGNATVESAQQTSVVDAIAQTMVGEWMWKYVRRRKSFGVPDSPNGWDGRDDSTGGGQRHKRWVWLAPYERAVMWSSRQPTSGNALLGKSGRKRMKNPPDHFPSLDRLLTKINIVPIQSVLDVKDDTPLPKGVSPTPIFNRSILILTPARALKFTAPNKERHYVWLTALSFLSHSAQEADGLLALPPPMPFEYEQVEQQQAQVTPTRIVTEFDAFPPPLRPRDSIRLAKSKKPEFIAQGSVGGVRKVNKLNGHAREDSIAEPPSIPRYPGQHVRRRSNTGSRPPNNRNFTTGSYSGSIRDSIYYGNGVVGGIGIPGTNSSMIYGTAHGDGSQMSGWDGGGIGTVRMEAFVDKKSKSEVDDDSLYNSPPSHRRDRHRKEQWSPSSAFDNYGKLNDSNFFRSHEPFRGF